MSSQDAVLDAVMGLVERARPVFAGQPPEVVGAALAELLAILLRGHHAETARETQQLRSRLLASHISIVRQLMQLSAPP